MKDHYKNMQSLTFEDGGHWCRRLEGAWLQMAPAADFNEAGWKFRLSIHPDDVAQAWNVAVEEMVNDKMTQHLAKVAMPHMVTALSDPENAQAGKMITIYTNSDVPPEHYQALMQAIEKKLSAANIRPGLEVKGDRKVPGSAFMSYRNDQDESGKYKAAKKNENLPDEQKYNTSGKPDPYRNFSISKAASAPLQDLMPKQWQAAVTQTGSPIARIGVENVAEAEQVIGMLKRMGITAKTHQSASMGLTVRVTGDDVAKVMESQKQPAVSKPRPVQPQRPSL